MLRMALSLRRGALSASVARMFFVMWKWNVRGYKGRHQSFVAIDTVRIACIHQFSQPVSWGHIEMRDGVFLLSESWKGYDPTESY